MSVGRVVHGRDRRWPRAAAFVVVMLAGAAGYWATNMSVSNAVEARQATGQERVVNIQYMPGLSNEKKLKDPFAATYSTLYLLHGAGGHSLTFESDEGVILLNTMAPGWGDAILGKLELITQEPVTTIINTHPDLEYTGSNAEFPDATRIVAHANTKAAMAKMPAFQGENARFLPNVVFEDTMSLFEERNRIDLYHFGAGHTDGDTVVIIPGYSIAYVGDLFPAKSLPVIDRANGGSVVALPDTLERALAVMKTVDVDYVVAGKVPAIGGKHVRVMSMRDVQEYIDFNRAFLAAVNDAIAAGRTVDEAASMLALPERFSTYDTARVRDAVAVAYAELKR